MKKYILFSSLFYFCGKVDSQGVNNKMTSKIKLKCGHGLLTIPMKLHWIQFNEKQRQKLVTNIFHFIRNNTDNLSFSAQSRQL